MTTATHQDAVQEERAAAAQLRRLEKARRAAAKKREAEARGKPRRLAKIDRRLEELSAAYKALPAYPEGQEARRAIRREIADLGRERYRLAWSE